MVRKTVIAMIVMMAGVALANKYVVIQPDGIVSHVLGVYGKTAEVDHDQNKYTDEEWAAFGITNDLPYIIKDGAAWRNMTTGEIAVVDAQLQEDIEDETTGDVQLDAILRTIAESINKNKKTYEAVLAVFKNEVDPKKAYKKEKYK